MEVSEAFLVSFLVTVHTVALFLLASLLRLKIGKIARLSGSLLFALLIFIGSTRGWLIFELVNVFDNTSTVSLSTRVVNSTITICIWGFIFSLIEARLQSFRDAYRRDFAKRAIKIASENRVSTIEIANAIDQMETIKAFQANLRQIASTADNTRLNHSQLIAAAQKIRREIEGSLRPLSHRIWFDSSAAQPKFHVAELQREALRNLDIRWFPTSLLITVATFFGSLSIYEPIAVAIRVGFYGLTLAALLYLLEHFRHLLRRSALRGGFALLAIGLLSSLVGELAVAFLLYRAPLSTDWVVVIAGPAATIGILWVEASFAQMRKDWGRVESALNQESSEVSMDVIKTRFAGYLHNSLQSQLAGIALALETTAPSDEEKISKILDRLRHISNQSIGVEFASHTTSPLDRLGNLVSAWSGIIDVKLDIDKSLYENIKLEIVVELIEEAISNSVRHSKAQVIEIDVRPTDAGIQVVIVHSAKNPKDGKGRMGQMWLDQFSQENSVEFTQDGLRRLVVTI
jgi:signal transduction histidine kinase